MFRRRRLRRARASWTAARNKNVSLRYSRCACEHRQTIYSTKKYDKTGRGISPCPFFDAQSRAEEYAAKEAHGARGE